MKLRYGFFPRSGPLTGVCIKFGADLSETDNPITLKRLGSINFVVGANGTGKSTILRAVFQAFRALASGNLPAQPIALAWDWQTGDGLVTVIVNYQPTETPEEAFPSWFAVLNVVPANASLSDWQSLIQRRALGVRGEPPMRFGELEALRGSSDFSAYLPSQIIAYTSGDTIPWSSLNTLEKPLNPPDDPEVSAEDDRPPDWNLQKEWGVALERSLKAPSEGPPTSDLTQKILANNMLAVRRDTRQRALIIEPLELRLAAVVFSLTQAAKELAGRTAEWQLDELRNQFLTDMEETASTGDARSVLSQIDWFWPTHLTLDYFDDGQSLSPPQQEQLLALLTLADTVVRKPDGSHRVVIFLGSLNESEFDFSKRLESAFSSATYGATLEALVARVGKARTGAEAVLRIFSDNKSIDSTLVEVFNAFLVWQKASVIRTINLTVQRLGRYTAFDGNKDNALVLMDQLSDGERMLISRMALLFLLRDQNGALLLLDEPETHLNDRWKRDLVNWVEKAVLLTTPCQVVVSTHTSIVLTDALAAEITVMQKTPDGVVVRGVAGGTYGTDPGEIMTNIYGADSSIGSNALENLERLLAAPWRPNQISELERILEKLGSSFHRAELRAKLDELKNQQRFDGAS